MFDPRTCKIGDFAGYHQRSVPAQISSDPSHWLIGVAEPPHEDRTCQRIRHAGVPVYLPVEHKQQRAGRRKLRDVVLPFLRPYFFVPASITDEQYLLVKHTRGVVGFLEIDSRPAVMRDAELVRARYRERVYEENRRRRILERGEGPHFMVDEQVEIMVGTARVSGTIHSVGGDRATVKLSGITLFGREVVEVDLAHLAPSLDL